jgi:hypothetical protein
MAVAGDHAGEDRTIGRQQGVNASNSPEPKNAASTANRLPLRMKFALASCSETKPPSCYCAAAGRHIH